jgi:hypothetical protein
VNHILMQVASKEDSGRRDNALAAWSRGRIAIAKRTFRATSIVTPAGKKLINPWRSVTSRNVRKGVIIRAFGPASTFAIATRASRRAVIYLELR